MKKIQLLISSFLLFPILSFGQLQVMGSNIDGAPIDQIGTTHSIDIDSVGTTIAFGTPFNSDFFPFSGYAKVMDWDGTDWIQRGDTFFGSDTTFEGTGAAVCLSADGMTVAVSSPWGYNSLNYKCGVVRVFDWNGTAWMLRGNIIEGEGSSFPAFAGDVFGTAMDLSPDGNKIVIGARGNTPQLGANQLSGHARVYHWDGNSWVQAGQDIDSDPAGGVQEFGYAVSINDAGDRVAIGARSFNTPTNNGAGSAKILQFDGTSWVQMGNTFFGDVLGANLGTAIELSSDGNTVAIGVPEIGGTGKTAVFDWNGTNWFLRGALLSGAVSSNFGQSLDLSHDANTIAIGEPRANSFNGIVRLFQWTGGTWQQVENTLEPANSTTLEVFGSAVRMNASGTRVIVGAPFNDVSGNSGRINVFGKGSMLSLSDLENAQAVCYPNPATSTLQVQTKSAIQEVTIVNALGQTIKTVDGNNKTEIQVNILDLTTGNYFVVLQTENTTTTIRFTKK
jgi:hypothetical protein